MTAALRAQDLGKRYGSTWALRNCTLTIPEGKVAALVGPNGAGKTTLLQLAVGLSTPTSGSVEIFDRCPQRHASDVLARIGFVAQDHPLFRTFTVREMMTAGARLNPRWDASLASQRLEILGIPPDKRAGKLSGGQQSQVALVMALAKRPDFLLLDEPIAALDPLARREFLGTLMEVAAEAGTTVLLSSHIIGDLERICDYIVILVSSQVALAGDIENIVESHRLLIGPRRETESIEHLHQVVSTTHNERQTTLLVRRNGHIWDPSWAQHRVSLEEIVLGYLGEGKNAGMAASTIRSAEEVQV